MRPKLRKVCVHNVLVKEIKANQEIRYSCMKCGVKFKAEEIITKPKET